MGNIFKATGGTCKEYPFCVSSNRCLLYPEKALTGLIVSAQVLTANARLNFGLELAAIATVVIGGTALDGGRANLIGTLLGSLLVAIINNGLNLLNVPIFYQQLTVGLLLLGALALSVRQGFSPGAYLRRQT